MSETAGETTLGAGLGVAEKFALPPIEQGIARLLPRHAGTITDTAADVAEEKIPSPVNPDKMVIPSRVEHEVESIPPGMVSQSRLPRLVMKHLLHSSSEIGEAAARAKMPPAQVSNPLDLTQTADPSFKSYLEASGQQGQSVWARGGLYGQMRSNLISSLRRS